MVDFWLTLGTNRQQQSFRLHDDDNPNLTRCSWKRWLNKKGQGLRQNITRSSAVENFVGLVNSSLSNCA